LKISPPLHNFAKRSGIFIFLPLAKSIYTKRLFLIEWHVIYSINLFNPHFMPRLTTSPKNKSAEIDILLNQVIFNKDEKVKKKPTKETKEFKQWKMPPSGEGYIKNKKNDPL
jgi:hypothetical protein